MANAVTSWRKRCGFTQEQAARKIGITLRNYQAYEAGTYDPPESIRRLMTVIEGGADPEPLHLGIKSKGRPEKRSSR